MIRILKYGEVANSEIFARAEATVDVASIVSGIIENVRKNGDKALLEYSEKFDKVQLSSVEVSKEEIDEAFASVDEAFLDVIKRAAVNIHNFHKRQVRNSFLIEGEDGIVMGQRITPIDRVGLYVPGGTAAYPSSVLMNSIPAKIAGCGMIVMVTPPGKDGKVNPNILAAAKIAGVDRIFKVGGAQAVAALAYGTETVPAVDKIVGPAVLHARLCPRENGRKALTVEDVVAQHQANAVTADKFLTDNKGVGKSARLVLNGIAYIHTDPGAVPQKLFVIGSILGS